MFEVVGLGVMVGVLVGGNVSVTVGVWDTVGEGLLVLDRISSMGVGEGVAADVSLVTAVCEANASEV